MLIAIFRQKNIGLKTIDSSDQVEGLLAVCRAHIVETGEDLIVANLFAKFAAYRAAFAAPNSETTMVEFPQIITITNDFLAELDKLVLINEQGMERSEKRTRELAQRTVHYSVGLLLAAILCALVLSSILSARLSDPLVRLAHTLTSVREGRGEYPRIPVTTSDEIGFLSTEFNRLFERLKVYALKILQTYSWPGNVRELVNVIERATILARHPYLISPADLPSHIVEYDHRQPPDQEMKPLAEMGKAHIQQVLANTSSMDEAAKILGIDPATLWRKRKRYLLD